MKMSIFRLQVVDKMPLGSSILHATSQGQWNFHTCLEALNAKADIYLLLRVDPGMHRMYHVIEADTRSDMLFHKGWTSTLVDNVFYKYTGYAE
jgi:hypothetical protein